MALKISVARLVLVLGLAWSGLAQAQSTANQVQPGSISTTGCPSGQPSCFLPYSATNPLPIGNNANTSTTSSVPASTSSTPVLTAKASRSRYSIFNDSSAAMYVLEGTGVASPTNYSYQIAAGGYYQTVNWTGDVNAVWSAANGNARVTDYPGPVPAAPAAPVANATPSNGQNTVAYTDGSPGTAPITAHKIYRSSVSGAETLVATVTTASPYVDGNLSNGATFFYKVSAVNSVGEGPLSGEVSGTPAFIAIPLMNVATNGMIMNSQGTVSGTKTRQVGRRQYAIGSSPITSLQAYFDNWYIQNQTTAAAETDNPSAITFDKVSIVYNGVSAPLTFGGARTANMAAGAVKFTTDELTTQALFGVAQIPANAAIELRWMVDVPASGTFACTQNREVSANEQAYLYDPTTTYTDNIDGTGALTVPSGATVSGVSGGFASSVGYIKPTMLGGRATQTFVSVFEEGDSLTDGVQDTGGDGTAAAIATTGFGGGAYRRAAVNAGDAFMVAALSGRTLANYVANRAKTIQYMPFHTHGVQALITNDVNGTLATVSANRRAAYSDMHAAGMKRIYQSLIGTYTTSTDQWTSLTGQTVTNGYAAGGNRDTENNAIIADVGAGYYLDGYIDIRVAQDDASQNTLFKVRPFTTTLSTALTGANASSVVMAAAPSVGEILAIDPTGAQSAAAVAGPVKSVSGTGPYTVTFWSGYVVTTKTAGTTISAMAAKDGLHNVPLVAAAVAADTSANGMATGFATFH